MEESIFQPYLGTRTIFKMDREILRPSYLPDRLPHRESHIGQLAQILVTALKGERPSNVLIFGKTGTGKTAVVKYIENEFRKADGARMVQYLYLNCEIVDTPYGVLQSIGNKFIENFHQRIPFTGLSTDRVYSLLLEKLDEEKRVVIVALDEIDKLVQKNGDDILYQLLKINDDLSKARVSLIGISNELTFTEYLDPRVRSRLADEKMVFPPYNADELYDILAERSRLAFENGTAADGVLHLIAALGPRTRRRAPRPRSAPGQRGTRGTPGRRAHHGGACAAGEEQDRARHGHRGGEEPSDPVQTHPPGHPPERGDREHEAHDRGGLHDVPRPVPEDRRDPVDAAPGDRPDLGVGHARPRPRPRPIVRPRRADERDPGIRPAARCEEGPREGRDPRGGPRLPPQGADDPSLAGALHHWSGSSFQES